MCSKSILNTMNNNILNSIPFWAAFFGVISAQMLKPLIIYIATREFRMKNFFVNGGMPSSHTSGVCALTAALGLTNGFGSNIFVLSLVITLIVMNDAMNVRLETGKQAELLNEWSIIFEEMFSEETFTRKHFKTMVGHTSLQVFWGMVLGIAIGVATFFVMR